MLKTYEKPELIKTFIDRIKENHNYNSITFYSYYIYNFYKFLNVKVLGITYLKYRNSYLLNLNKHIKYILNEDNKIRQTFSSDGVDIKKDKQEIIEVIESIPDILILYHSELDYFYSSNATSYIYQEDKSSEFKKTYDSKTYNLKLDSTIANYKDIINFNGHKYKLDSCLIFNYNDKGNGNHIIAGITCNKNRYVFNSWKHAEHKYTKTCPLIKYNWNLRSNDEFTLDRIKCGLKKIDPVDLTFSFNKGRRTLVYVRIDDKEDIIDDLISNSISSEYVSNMDELINEFHDIKNMNKEKILNEIKKYGYILDEDINIETLRNFLIKEIKKK